MDFGKAIRLLKDGKKVARSGWNGKGMYLYLKRFPSYNDEIVSNFYEYCIVMFTADKKHQPGWLASQTDILAEDWVEVA